MDDTSFERLINIQSYSDEELRELADPLAAEERELSKRRRLLHGEIDIVRAEMVRRLRDKHSAGAGWCWMRRCGGAHRHPQWQAAASRLNPASEWSTVSQKSEPPARGIESGFVTSPSMCARSAWSATSYVRSRAAGTSTTSCDDPYVVAHSDDLAREPHLRGPASDQGHRGADPQAVRRLRRVGRRSRSEWGEHSPATPQPGRDDRCSTARPVASTTPKTRTTAGAVAAG